MDADGAAAAVCRELAVKAEHRSGLLTIVLADAAVLAEEQAAVLAEQRWDLPTTVLADAAVSAAAAVLAAAV